MASKGTTHLDQPPVKDIDVKLVNLVIHLFQACMLQTASESTHSAQRPAHLLTASTHKAFGLSLQELKAGSW